MRADSSFSKKIEMVVSKQLENEIAVFANLSACAGIRDDEENAMKARINHYGSKSNSIPARRFVWAATRNISFRPYGDEIAEIIAKGIHDNPSPHTQKTLAPLTSGGRQEVVKGSAKHGRPVFAGRRGGLGVLEKIAKQMEINQFNAISALNFVGPKNNKPSTIRIKGFDHPLEWTGEMEFALESWVEEQ